jgi:hypothetical protein
VPKVYFETSACAVQSGSGSIGSVPRSCKLRRAVTLASGAIPRVENDHNEVFWGGNMMLTLSTKSGT